MTADARQRTRPAAASFWPRTLTCFWEPGSKICMNVGANQGVKVGDYLRAVRTYEGDLRDPVDSLSFKASATEDTQKFPASIEGHMFTRTKGPAVKVTDMPRRAMGEIVVINVTPTTATGMLVFALEDVHVGDQVELDISPENNR